MVNSITITKSRLYFYRIYFNLPNEPNVAIMQCLVDMIDVE